MKNFLLLLVFSLFLEGCATTHDFHGLTLLSRKHAEDLAHKDLVSEAFKSAQGNEITAYADMEYVLGEISGFWVTIVNNSHKAINTNYCFTEYSLITKDGMTLPLKVPDVLYFPSSQKIDRKGSGGFLINASSNQATYRVRLGRPKVAYKDIKMIVCSFDLGKTRIFLFPNSARK